MSSAIVPPFLRSGDTVGLVCPAGFMEAEKTDAAQARLESWGFRVRRGKTVGGHSGNYFSGTDAERLSDLQTMLDDKNVHAILCGRGGYGLSRIIDQLKFKKFSRQPKWILGYSDITLLHNHIYRNYHIVSGHSPMAGAFNEPMDPNPFTDSVRELLTGRPFATLQPGHRYNRSGTVTGPLIGGNLTLLAHSIGSAAAPKTKNAILFFEDIGEYLYNLDRMLYQLKRAGKFRKVAAVVVGHFTEMKDTVRPFGLPAYDIIREAMASYSFPVCYGFPVGHETQNFALKHGAIHTIAISGEKVSLTEIKTHS